MTADRPEPPDEVPARIGHFLILGLLGKGGMGAVYRARDEGLGRVVALKLLRATSSDPSLTQRFLREARSGAAIAHANVATVFEVGEAEGYAYIAMELIEGATLRDRLGGRLEIPVACELAVQIARGLGAAHERGIAHRDLKPENVMIGPGGVVKLLDFGLAKAVLAADPIGTPAEGLANTERALTVDRGQLLGTPAYMSPEQALGQPVDLRSDVFSFGIVLYEMLAGVRPFSGQTPVEILVSITRDAPVPLRQRRPQVDATLDAVVARCLAKAPGERFPDARELVQALSGKAVFALATPPLHRTNEVTRGRSRLPGWIAVAALTLVGIGVGRWIARRPWATRTQVEPRATERGGWSTSSNAEAQRLWEQAALSFHQGLGHERELLDRALELDPGFGGACLRRLTLAAAWDSVDSADVEAKLSRQAIQLQSTLSPREQKLLSSLIPYDPRQVLPKLDGYLASNPDDEMAWALRGSALQTDPTSLDRALAAEPALPYLLASRSQVLLAQEDYAAARQAADRCLEASSFAVDCIRARTDIENHQGLCSDSERDVELWLDLQPGSKQARLIHAGLIAARGASLEAIREAMGPMEPAYWSQAASPEAILADYTGDFESVVRLATAADERLPESASRMERFWTAVALTSAYDEEGDMKSAARVANRFLERQDAWRSANPDWEPVFVAGMVSIATRGNALAPREGSERIAGLFRSAIDGGLEPLEAWTRFYGNLAETQEESRDAVAVLDRLAVGSASPYGISNVGPTLYLGGRGDQARLVLERITQGCSNELIVPIQWVRAHLYLGLLDEQASNKDSACEHYAKVEHRWGAARPHSRTAAQAEERAKALACPGGSSSAR